MIGSFVRDLRIAARVLAKSRGFAAVAIITLALGMALNATVLAVVNAYLLKSLPYPGGARLYNVLYSRPGESYPRGMDRLDWRMLDDVIEHAISWDLDMYYLIGGDYPETAPGAWITPGFVQGLGLKTALGRGFAPEDFQSGSPQVALISHSLWQSRFGGDPGIIGQRFEAYVSDRPHEVEAFTIVGILPSGFWHVNRYMEIFAPLRAESYPYLVRLREGVPPSDAERRITDLVKNGAGPLPDGWKAQIRSTHGEYVSRVRPILTAVTAAAGLVLLIACANVAFLSLIRATHRQKEIAVRMALGATRSAIARMLTAEALLLGLVATSAGIALGRLSIGSIAPIAQRQLERPVPGGVSAIAIDGTILAGAAAICILTAVLFALAPLLTSIGRRENLSSALHRGKGSGTESKNSRRTRSVLIALEVAGSLALLAGCGLMIRSVVHVLQVDFGYRTEGVITARLGLRDRSYPDAPARAAFYRLLLSRVSDLPGIESAALAERSILVPFRPQPIEAEVPGGLAAHQATVLAVSERFPETVGVPLVAGRGFTDRDEVSSDPVAMVSESLARRIWPGTDPVGRKVVLASRSMGGAAPPPPNRRTVVGVLRDVRQSADDQDLADLYVPMLQAPGRFASIFVRSQGAPANRVPRLRQALKEIDPEIALDGARPLESDIVDQLSRPKFLASLLSGFALFSILLALIALYAVIAYAVKQREREIAIRIALGAESRSVTLLFLRQGAIVLLAGLAGGIAGAAALGRTLQSQLHGVGPSDPLTLIAVSAALAAAGLAAIWHPARRAAATDPMVALREE